MISLTLDTLQLRGPLAPYIYLQQADGLEAPAYRMSQYDNPGESGGTVSSTLYGTRVVTLAGEINAPDVATYETLRQNLAYAARIQLDSNSFPVPTQVSFTTLDGNSYFVNGYVQTFKHPLGYPTSSKFQVTLVVPDPMVYGSQLQSSGQVTVPVGGGATFPWIFPVTFGSTTGGVATITNGGNAYSWPILYIRGAVTNPRVYSLQAGRAVQLSYTTTQATDVIAIDMKNKTIVLNGSTNLLSAKSTDSQWFSLAPGTNTIQFTSSSTSDTGTLEVTAFNAFLGV